MDAAREPIARSATGARLDMRDVKDAVRIRVEKKKQRAFGRGIGPHLGAHVAPPDLRRAQILFELQNVRALQLCQRRDRTRAAHDGVVARRGRSGGRGRGLCRLTLALRCRLRLDDEELSGGDDGHRQDDGDEEITIVTIHGRSFANGVRAARGRNPTSRRGT